MKNVWVFYPFRIYIPYYDEWMVGFPYIMKKERFIGMSFWHISADYGGYVDALTGEMTEMNLFSFAEAPSSIGYISRAKRMAGMFNSMKIGDWVAVECSGFMMAPVDSHEDEKEFDNFHFMIGRITSEVRSTPLPRGHVTGNDFNDIAFMRHKRSVEWIGKLYPETSPSELKEFSKILQVPIKRQNILRLSGYAGTLDEWKSGYHS